MQKKNNKKIHQTQSRIKTHKITLNELSVLIPLLHKPLTFSELHEETRLSKPILSKHLKFWTNSEIIYKDTIKPIEATNPKDIGKIVYRAIPAQPIPNMVAAMETALQIPKPYWNEKSKAKLRKHLEAIANIILDEYDKRMDEKLIIQK